MVADPDADLSGLFPGSNDFNFFLAQCRVDLQYVTVYMHRSEDSRYEPQIKGGCGWTQRVEKLH
jgi:hypothetical protein